MAVVGVRGGQSSGRLDEDEDQRRGSARHRIRGRREDVSPRTRRGRADDEDQRRGAARQRLRGRRFATVQ